MTIARIAAWLDGILEPSKFDDVSNNGLQVARTGDEVTRVAFGVDASVAFLRRAAEWGAELCVVHHGISWGGGIRRLVGSEYAVVKAAMDANLALFASHLPLDANRRCGNNWEIARHLHLKRIRPAFSYHGNVIGVIGEKDGGHLVGVCSGGAGEFAVAAKALGCEVYVTGEASWGDVVAAENVGMRMICAGHYETEVFGVRALSRLMAAELGVETRLFLRETEASCC